MVTYSFPPSLPEEASSVRIAKKGFRNYLLGRSEDEDLSIHQEQSEMGILTLHLQMVGEGNVMRDGHPGFWRCKWRVMWSRVTRDGERGKT